VISLRARFHLCAMAVLFLSGSFVAPAAAQTDKQVADLQAAWRAAGKTAVFGPREIKLLDQASLQLPAGEAFIPATEANGIMTALGNRDNPNRFGLIVSRDPKADWLVDVNWIKEGYVRDGDAKEWQPDTMLDGLKEATETDNKDRIARGIPALDIVGWVEPPTYQAATHRLVWSLSSRDRGAPADMPQTINYNTYALGRDGFFSLDLITGANKIASEKGIVRDLLGSLNYVPGKRYEDFDSSTDKVAAYGLAGLVGAVAIKKLGLLALATAFVLKLWKLAILAVLGLWAGVKRFFKGRSSPADEI